MTLGACHACNGFEFYQDGPGIHGTPGPASQPGEIRVKVAACGVCRTDLHVVDGELPNRVLPIIPGHEIVGRIDRLGSGVEHLRLGERVGIPWLGHTCGVCPYCRAQRENLCDRPLFTGFTRDGGFATSVVADARYAFPLGEAGDDAALAPLLCAGLIGWRSLGIAGDGKALGLYGFGAAAHIVARWHVGKASQSLPSPGPGTLVIRPSPEVWAQYGPADQTKCHHSRLTQR